MIRTQPQPNGCTDTEGGFLAQTEEKHALDPATFRTFPLASKTLISHNTAIYRFRLPTPRHVLGLPIGQHISLAASLPVTDPKTGVTETKEVVRSYTPISSDVTPGHFDLLIKSYPTGNISRHLATLNIGDTMRVKGPKGAMVYTPNMVRRIGMIAGGTGITPMLQIVKAIVRGRSGGDRTRVDLIFANVDEKDILLREDLRALEEEEKGFRVFYVLNNPPEGWKGGVGFVTADMIKVCVRPACLEGWQRLDVECCLGCVTVADGDWANSFVSNPRSISRHRLRISRSSCAGRRRWWPP